MKLLHVISGVVSKEFYIKNIQRMISFIQKHKVVVGGIVFIAVAAFFVFAPEVIWAKAGAPGTTKQLAKATVGTIVSLQQYVVQFLGYVVYYLIVVPLGWFIILLFQVLTAVASYNEFLASAAVTKGWVIVRDIANMAVIVFLVIVAFSMILGYEAYGNRKTLARLLIMAVLINFSKTICGIFIDISQVVMLTFVNGFKFISGVSLVQGMQLDKMMKLGNVPKDGQIPTLINALASVILAAMFMFTILVVIIVIIMTLVWRIVNLWMLVILSPLAFLASAFSVGPLGSLYSQWQKKFMNFLVNGPILAFFLWLALTIMNGLQQVTSGDASAAAQSGVQGLYSTANGVAGATLTEAFTGGNVSLLIISIGLLCASLVLSAEFGAVGAKQGLSKIKSGTVGAVKKGLKWTARAQDAALGIGTATLFGRPVNFASGARLAKKVGTKAALGAQQWYYKSGQETAKRGGVFGELRTMFHRKRAGGNFFQRNNTPQDEMMAAQERMDSIKKDKQQFEDFAGYQSDVSRLSAYKTIQHLSGSNSQADKDKAEALAAAIGVSGGAAGVTGKSVSDLEEKIANQREDLKSRHGADALEGVDKNNLAMVAKLNDDGTLSVDRNKEFGGSQSELDRIAGEVSGASAEGAKKMFDDAIQKQQDYYDTMSQISLSRQTGLSFLKNAQVLQENKSKRLEQYEGRYQNLNNESEIAGHIANANRNGDRDAIQFLFKKAMEQGMLKKVAKEVLKGTKIDGEQVGLDLKGLGAFMGYDPHSASAGIAAEDVDFFQEIAKKGKEEGIVGFASGVATDSKTGQTFFTHKKDSDDFPGMNQQDAANLERIKKRQMKTRDMYDAMVGDIDSETGELTLSNLGKEAVKRFGENFLEDIRRGTSGAAFDEAIAHEMTHNKSEYSGDGEAQRLGQLVRRVRQKQSGNAESNIKLSNSRDNKIDQYHKAQEVVDLGEASGLSKEFLAHQAKQASILKQEVEDLNAQLGFAVDNMQNMNKELERAKSMDGFDF